MAKVLGVKRSVPEEVFDITVEGNHNFVANGIVVHNCHIMGADQFSKAAAIYNSKLRLGLSATAYRKDGKDVVFKAHIGEVRVVSKDEALAPRVIMVKSDFRLPRVRKVIRDRRTGKPRHVIVPMPVTAGRTMHINKMLAKDQSRNKQIIDFVVAAYKKGRHVIAFSDLKEAHLEKLYPMARAAGIPAGAMAFYVGGMSESEREEAKKKQVIWSTYKMASMATDIPRLDTCVLMTPRSDVNQIVGRIRREHPDKAVPLVFDIIDSDCELFVGYARSRVRWYHKIGAEVLKRY